MSVNRWIREIATDATFWLVLVFLTASAYSAYVLSVEFRDAARTHDLAAAARAQSELLTATRSYYAREVVQKVAYSNDIIVSHDHVGRDLTIPAPVTMTLALEDELARIGSPSNIRLVSNYPFSWRKGRSLDAFHSDALSALNADPSKPFQRMEETESGTVFRSAEAVIMEETCVSCHNSHNDSPKHDWKVGDVRGLQEVVIPASTIQQHDETYNNLFFLLAIAFAAAAGLSILLSWQRQRAIRKVADLAGRERQKNASLRDAIARAEAGEAQVAAIIDTMAEGLLTIAREGEIRSANPAALHMLGVAGEEQVIGHPVGDFLPQATELRALFNQSQASTVRDSDKKKANKSEMKLRNLAGHEYPVEVSMSGVECKGLDIYTAILRDLSDEKAAAEKLKRAETRLVDAIESLPDGFVLYDSDDRLVICNSRYREFYSTSADAIKEGALFEDIIREGAKLGQYKTSDKALEDWVAMRMDHHRNPGDPMEQLLDDGRWLRVIESRTSDGGLVGFRVDITELKEREEDLKQSQDLLRNVVDASFDGVIVMDGDGLVVEYSPAAVEVFGWQREEIIGQNMSGFVIPKRYRQMHSEGLKKFLETGDGAVIGQRIEIEGLHKDGHEIVVELAIRHTEGPTGPLFLGYVRDITEQRAADAALREAKEKAEIANEAKAKFLAMMSHEIRTPLNGVLGTLSLLRDTSLEPEQKLYVHTARESGRALLDLINDILDFTKLEAGRMELYETPCNLRKVLGGIIDLFTAIAREKDLDLSINYPAAVPANVVADAGRLRQVVLNLVSNALKFTELGSVKIAVVLAVDDPDKPTFRIEVADTGVGIPKDKHGSLFGDFVTVDSSYARKTSGSGLGLAICRQLAELMKGHITFESLPGAGSTFRFTVPLKLATDEQLPPEPTDEPTYDLPTGLRILLAEDNATNQIVVSHALEKAGCDVDIAHNGREAVNFAASRSYDCILMDISMPEMDGLEATEEIRAATRNQRSPIIALTAYSLRGDREKFLKSGMDDFLSKPVEKDELLAKIAQHIDAPLVANNATSPNPADEVAGDMQEAENILASMPEEIQEKLVVQFLSDISTRTEAASRARLEDDLGALEKATHALKSVAGAFGAKELLVAAKHINELALDNKRRQAMEATEDLLQVGERTRSKVRALAVGMGISVAEN